MAPGYKDLYKYYIMLSKALVLNGEVFRISVKNISLLYEYWCFIKLNSIIMKKFKLVKQDIIKVKSNLNNISYVALYQSKDKFDDEAGIKHYGKVQRIEIIKRKEIKELPKNDDALYVKFYVDEWIKLERPIKPKEYWVRSHIYTNINLLKTSEYLPELCIKNKNEYRLYMELKRLTEIQFGFNNKPIDEANNYFILNGYRVFVKNKDIYITKPDYLQKFKLSEFVKKPRAIVNMIKEVVLSNN